MIRLEWRGVNIVCETVAEVLAIVDAVGDRVGAPARVEKPLSDSLPIEPPASRERREPPKLNAPHVTGVGGRRIGRKPTFTDEELVQLHSRLVKGERIEDLAATKGKPARLLYQAFNRKGLPVKFPRANADVVDPDPEVSNIRIDRGIPVRKLAPGQSGIQEEDGSYRKARP